MLCLSVFLSRSNFNFFFFWFFIKSRLHQISPFAHKIKKKIICLSIFIYIYIQISRNYPAALFVPARIIFYSSRIKIVFLVFFFYLFVCFFSLRKAAKRNAVHISHLHRYTFICLCLCEKWRYVHCTHSTASASASAWLA